MATMTVAHKKRAPALRRANPTPLRRLFPVSPSIMNRMITRPAVRWALDVALVIKPTWPRGAAKYTNGPLSLADASSEMHAPG